MKKMTFLAALLGVTQFSNAQVGIGTANPADAVQSCFCWKFFELESTSLFTSLKFGVNSFLNYHFLHIYDII